VIPDYYPLPEIGQAWEDNPDWTYPLAADGTCGHAHLRTWAARFARTGDGMLAVVTELAGNPGVSVTNGARWIMNALMRSYPGEDIVLFEHYPAYAGETEHLDGVIWGGDPMTYWRGGKPGWYRIWPAGRDHPRYEQLRDRRPDLAHAGNRSSQRRYKRL
jgi:hypothetical protein